MRERPTNNIPKTRYLVTIDTEEYFTAAYTEQAAISNAAYRHSEYTGESVGLIMWKIREEKIECEVEEAD